MRFHLQGTRPAETEKPLSIKFFTKALSVEGAELRVGPRLHHRVSKVEYQFWLDARYAGKNQGQWGGNHPQSITIIIIGLHK